MRLSQLFGKPIKSVPNEAQSISHKLLHQGGFIRQIAAGRYAFLPLGYLVAEKIVQIIDEEMRSLGSQRIETPTLHPIEIWQKTNRDEAFGDLMLVTQDHRGADFAIGATAEGLMTEIVKSEALSYKDLPILIHQFSQKFRDELRPRGGLLRTREFMMKDAYSFHESEEDLLAWYEKFHHSYLSIAKKLGLNVVPVEADSGAIGGEYNHEFMVLSESGEDTVVVSSDGNYAANLERAESDFEIFDQEKELKEVREFVHQEAVTCEALAQAMGIPVHHTTKTILFAFGQKADTDTGEGFVAAMVRGDYEINEVKLARVLGVETLRLATPEEVQALTGAVVGFVGPVGLPEKVRVVADLTCKNRINFEAGSNKTGVHLYNLNYDRDFPTPQFADIRLVIAGDRVKGGDGILQFKRAIEWGHTFHQGQFYAKPHEAQFTSTEGVKQTLWQGAYGIGIGRSIAAIVETHHDEKGIIWPKSVAPFQVHLLAISSHGSEKSEESDGRSYLNSGKSETPISDVSDVSEIATKLYEELVGKGIEVLHDDREVSPGVKLTDADLIGIPVRIIISSRSLASGGVEVSRRDNKTQEIVPLDKLASLASSI